MARARHVARHPVDIENRKEEKERKRGGWERQPDTRIKVRRSERMAKERTKGRSESGLRLQYGSQDFLWRWQQEGKVMILKTTTMGAGRSAISARISGELDPDLLVGSRKEWRENPARRSSSCEKRSRSRSRLRY